MVLLHGWINSRSESKELLDTIEWMKTHEGFSVNKSFMNGEVVFHIFSCRNGYSESFNQMLEKLKGCMIYESPDTYGLIYLFNDEDKADFDIWQVWVLNHNKLERQKDNFLSPYSEKIAWYPEEDR